MPNPGDTGHPVQDALNAALRDRERSVESQKQIITNATREMARLQTDMDALKRALEKQGTAKND